MGKLGILEAGLLEPKSIDCSCDVDDEEVKEAVAPLSNCENILKIGEND